MTKLQKLGLAGAAAALACFVFVGGTALLTDSVMYRSLAFMASMGIGYLTYEFGDVLRAGAKAAVQARAVWIELKLDLKRPLGRCREGIKEFYYRPHPFLPLGSIVSALFMAYVVSLDVRTSASFPPPIFASLTTYTEAVTVVWCAVALLSSFLFYMLAYTGARVWEKKLWESTDNVLEQEAIEEEGLTIVPLTYGDAYRWLLKGFFQVFLSVPWMFIRTIIKLVHSSERMMVTVDGNSVGLALMAGYWYFGSASPTILDYTVLMVFGSVLGMVSVVVSVRYVAPRFGYNLLAQKA